MHYTTWNNLLAITGQVRVLMAITRQTTVLPVVLPNKLLLGVWMRLAVTTPITMDGSTAVDPTIDANHTNQVVSTTTLLTITTLTIANSSTSGDGGAIHAASALTLKQVNIGGSGSANSIASHCHEETACPVGRHGNDET